MPNSNQLAQSIKTKCLIGRTRRNLTKTIKHSPIGNRFYNPPSTFRDKNVANQDRFKGAQTRALDLYAFQALFKQSKMKRPIQLESSQASQKSNTINKDKLTRSNGNSNHSKQVNSNIHPSKKSISIRNINKINTNNQEMIFRQTFSIGKHINWQRGSNVHRNSQSVALRSSQPGQKRQRKCLQNQHSQSKQKLPHPEQRKSSSLINRHRIERTPPEKLLSRKSVNPEQQSSQLINQHQIDQVNPARTNERILNTAGDKIRRNLVEMNRTGTNFRRAHRNENHDNYLDQYQIIGQLGKGTYGLVHLAKLKSKDQSNNELELVKHGQSLKMASTQFNNSRSQRFRESSQAIIEVEKSKQQFSADNSTQSVMGIQRTQQFSTTKPTQKLFAIKVYQKFKINKDPSKFKNIRKQITIMQNINHPNIIKLHESVETLTKISLVVEYGGGFSLLEYLKTNYPLKDIMIKNIAQQLLSALAYLHGKNIVHRDIKLQNVLMLGEQVKLIDFGFSTLSIILSNTAYKNRKLNAICGTPNYMAPQLLSRKDYVGQQADMWSFGVLIFTLGEGRHPFKANNYNQLERLANRGNYQFKMVTNPIFQSFIRKILRINGNERPRANEMLLHPWLSIKD